VIQLSSGRCQIVITDGSWNGGDILHISIVLTLPWFLYILFIVGYFSTEEELLVSVDYKCGVSYTDNFSYRPQPNIIELFECFSMKLSFNAQLSMLIASQHEQVSIIINNCYMIVTTWDVCDVLARLYYRFLLLYQSTSFV